MKKGFLVFVLLALSSLFITCSKEDEDFNYYDGTAGFLATEISSMNYSIMNALSSSSAFKEISLEDTTEVIITPWHVDSSISGFVRKAQCNFTNGQRIRVDTVYFYDDSNHLTISPAFLNISHFTHKRNIQGNFGDNTINLNFDMNVVINKSSDTLAVRNGYVEGTINDSEITRTRTITDVTWKYENNNWSLFPISGTINIYRHLRIITITFSGENTAIATIENRSNHNIRTIIISLVTGVEG